MQVTWEGIGSKTYASTLKVYMDMSPFHNKWRRELIGLCAVGPVQLQSRYSVRQVICHMLQVKERVYIFHPNVVWYKE